MEEPYSGGSNEAWIAFIKNWARENGYPRKNQDEDLESQLIREVDNLRELCCKIWGQMENTEATKEKIAKLERDISLLVIMKTE